VKKCGVTGVVWAQVSGIVFKLRPQSFSRHYSPVDDIAERENRENIFPGQITFFEVPPETRNDLTKKISVSIWRAPDAPLIGDGDGDVVPFPHQHAIGNHVRYQALSPGDEPQVDLGDTQGPSRNNFFHQSNINFLFRVTTHSV